MSKYWFKRGIESGYDLCCIFFFMHGWRLLDKEARKNWTSTKDGYIPCPDCLAKYMQEQKLKTEIESTCILSETEKDILLQQVKK